MAKKLSAKQQAFIDEYKINAQRFQRLVDRSSGNDACWPFTGAKDPAGYGRYHVGRSRSSSMLSHRVAFGLAYGYLPEAVCHQCDNPECCNPAHLFGGTRAINNRDMADKGRCARVKAALWGEKHHQARLTDKDAEAIKTRYLAGGVSQRALATQHGVSQRTINKIVRGISFRKQSDHEVTT